MIVYKTTNLINEKIYIGQDSNNNPEYIGSGNLLLRAIKKYGINNFKKEILEICKSKDELNNKEKFWIAKYNSTNKKIGYNISEGGTGGKLVPIEAKKGKTYIEYYGEEKTKEICLKFSIKRKGKKRNYVNFTKEEVDKKISDALISKEMKRSDITKNQISNSVTKYFTTKKGKKLKNKLSKLRKGIPLSEETRRRQSESMKKRGIKPKVLEVHPSSQYWYFYNKKNELIKQTLGNYIKTLKTLNTHCKKLVKFTSLEECLSYCLPDNKHFKVFHEKYYK